MAITVFLFVLTLGVPDLAVGLVICILYIAFHVNTLLEKEEGII